LYFGVTLLNTVSFYRTGYIPLPSVEEMDLDPNENGFDGSCVNVVGAGYFIGVVLALSGVT
jgi:hypothetical protein